MKECALAVPKGECKRVHRIWNLEIGDYEHYKYRLYGTVEEQLNLKLYHCMPYVATSSLKFQHRLEVPFLKHLLFNPRPLSIEACIVDVQSHLFDDWKLQYMNATILIHESQYMTNQLCGSQYATLITN